MLKSKKIKDNTKTQLLPVHSLETVNLPVKVKEGGHREVAAVNATTCLVNGSGAIFKTNDNGLTEKWFESPLKTLSLENIDTGVYQLMITSQSGHNSFKKIVITY